MSLLVVEIAGERRCLRMQSGRTARVGARSGCDAEFPGLPDVLCSVRMDVAGVVAVSDATGKVLKQGVPPLAVKVGEVGVGVERIGWIAGGDAKGQGGRLQLVGGGGSQTDRPDSGGCFVVGSAKDASFRVLGEGVPGYACALWWAGENRVRVLSLDGGDRVQWRGADGGWGQASDALLPLQVRVGAQSYDIVMAEEAGYRAPGEPVSFQLNMPRPSFFDRGLWKFGVPGLLASVVLALLFRAGDGREVASASGRVSKSALPASVNPVVVDGAGMARKESSGALEAIPASQAQRVSGVALEAGAKAAVPSPTMSSSSVASGAGGVAAGGGSPAGLAQPARQEIVGVSGGAQLSPGDSMVVKDNGRAREEKQDVGGASGNQSMPAVVAAVGAVKGAVSGEGRQGTVGAAPVRVALLEFENSSPDLSMEPLRKGLREAMRGSFAGAERAGSVSLAERGRVAEVLKELRINPGCYLDAGAAARVGQKLEVDMVLTGSFVVTAEQVRFEMRLVRSGDGEVLLTQQTAGKRAEFAGVQRQLVAKSLGRMSAGPAPVEDVGGAGPRFEAFLGYSRGVFALEAGDPARARREWRGALESDDACVAARRAVVEMDLDGLVAAGGLRDASKAAPGAAAALAGHLGKDHGVFCEARMDAAYFAALTSLCAHAGLAGRFELERDLLRLFWDEFSARVPAAESRAVFAQVKGLLREEAAFFESLLMDPSVSRERWEREREVREQELRSAKPRPVELGFALDDLFRGRFREEIRDAVSLPRCAPIAPFRPAWRAAQSSGRVDDGVAVPEDLLGMLEPLIVDGLMQKRWADAVRSSSGRFPDYRLYLEDSEGFAQSRNLRDVLVLCAGAVRYLSGVQEERDAVHGTPFGICVEILMRVGDSRAMRQVPRGQVLSSVEALRALATSRVPEEDKTEAVKVLEKLMPLTKLAGL